MLSMKTQQQPSHDDRFEFDMAIRMELARRRSGIEVQELAQRLEVSRNTVSNWINGHSTPREGDLKRFALAVGYPAEWLRYGMIPNLQMPDYELAGSNIAFMSDWEYKRYPAASHTRGPRPH